MQRQYCAIEADEPHALATQLRPPVKGGQEHLLYLPETCRSIHEVLQMKAACMAPHYYQNVAVCMHYGALIASLPA